MEELDGVYTRHGRECLFGRSQGLTVSLEMPIPRQRIGSYSGLGEVDSGLLVGRVGLL